MLKRALLAALLLAPLPAHAQEVRLTCSLSIICVEISPCADLEQEIVISQTDGAWSVDWSSDLPSDYQQIATIPAPEGSLEPTVLHSLIHANADTQAVQIISFAESGNLVLTLHQPHVRPQSVTGYGTCEETPE